MLLIDRAPVPVLLSVTDWAALVVPTFWLANVRLPAVSDTIGAPTPVPERVTVWGDPAALSVMVTDALRIPAAVGVKVTEMLQLPPAATLAPQVLVCAKWPALVPVTPRLLIRRVAVPMLLSVTDWAALVVPTFWLAKVRLPAVSDTIGAPTPVPERVTVWGDPAALSVMVTDAPRIPAAVGVKVTEMLQLPPAATLAPQVLVCAKSPRLVPVTARLLIRRVAVPVLLSVTDWAALVVPTFWLAKVRLPAVRDTIGAPTPVPERVTVWGDPAALSVMVTDAPRLPAAVGVKVTEMLQLPPAATLAPQVLVCAKSPGFIPVTARLLIRRVAVPVLLRVTDWASLVVPTFWLVNVRLPEVSDTIGTATPVPERVTV